MRGTLIIGDQHFTDRPEDEYRWDLFTWIHRLLNSGLRPIHRIWWMGDLTHHKDCHSARFLNRILSEFQKLADREVDNFILMGNHDFVDRESPFFRFLGLAPRCMYIDTIQYLEIDGSKVLAVPYQNDWLNSWSPWTSERMEADFILLHQTFEGAKDQYGTEMPGPSVETFKECKLGVNVLCGDIHVPQKVYRVQYVGVPHPINYGDDFNKRVGYITMDNKLTWIPYPAIRKLHIHLKSVEEFAGFKFQEGDQIKLTVHLPRTDYPLWPNIREDLHRILEENKAFCGGIELREEKLDRNGQTQETPHMATLDRTEVVRSFSERNRLDEATTTTGVRLAE